MSTAVPQLEMVSLLSAELSSPFQCHCAWPYPCQYLKSFRPRVVLSPCLCVGEMAEAERGSTLAAIQFGADCGTKEMFDCISMNVSAIVMTKRAIPSHRRVVCSLCHSRFTPPCARQYCLSLSISVSQSVCLTCIHPRTKTHVQTYCTHAYTETCMQTLIKDTHTHTHTHTHLSLINNSEPTRLA